MVHQDHWYRVRWPKAVDHLPLNDKKVKVVEVVSMDGEEWAVVQQDGGRPIVMRTRYLEET